MYGSLNFVCTPSINMPHISLQDKAHETGQPEAGVPICRVETLFGVNPGTSSKHRTKLLHRSCHTFQWHLSVVSAGNLRTGKYWNEIPKPVTIQYLQNLTSSSNMTTSILQSTSTVLPISQMHDSKKLYLVLKVTNQAFEQYKIQNHLV